MRTGILYLVPDLIGPPGGIARYCRLVSQALLEAHLPLTVLALQDRQEAGAQAAVLFPGMDYRACAGSRPQFIAQSLRQTLQQRPQLVLVGHPNFAGLGDILRRLSQAPLIGFIYGVDVWRPLPRWARRSIQDADRVISISHFTAQKGLACNALPPDRLRILHNCLDPVFTPPPVPPHKDGRLSLLTVSRISQSEHYKGHEYVLHALPSLLSAFPHLIYDVVGDGQGRPLLERLAAELGVISAVRFHGLVSEERLREFYTQASVFIMPSAREGFGFVFLEAMAYGLPVIAGNQDATTEVVADGETGLLVNPTSVEQITQAATRLLGDAGLRQRMGRAGVQRVSEHFSYPQFQARLLHYLAELKVI